MSQFTLTANPCAQENGFTSIVITNVLGRKVVDVKLDQLRDAMAAFGATLTSDEPDHKSITVCAYPTGRAPNGFKAFEAQRKNSIVIDRASAPQAQTFIYAMKNLKTGKNETTTVWSDCETKAFKAVCAAYGDAFSIGSYTTSPSQFATGINCQ